jgi:hypothetical protein
MNNYLQEVLDEFQENEEIFYSITDYAMDKEIENGFNDLNDIEKKSFMVGKFFMEVNNGGFDQYFVNTEGVYAKATLDFLDYIGEKCFSKLLEEAISIFKAVISDDRKTDEFDKMDNKFYYLNTVEFETLYEKYVNYLKHNMDNA